MREERGRDGGREGETERNREHEKDRDRDRHKHQHGMLVRRRCTHPKSQVILYFPYQ